MKDCNVELEKQKIQEEAVKQKDFFEFCANPALIKTLIDYQLTQIALQKKNGGIIVQQKMKVTGSTVL